MPDSQLPDELLPPKVKVYRSADRARMRMCYAFFHSTYGSLGRIYFTPASGGQLYMECEAAGSQGSPMTEKRKKMITQLSKLLPSQIDTIFGKTDDEPPAVMLREKSLIESKVLVCLTCDAPVAHLIFAEDTKTPSEGDASPELEDYACLMHQKIVDYNVPSWVIGDSDPISEEIGYAWTLKIWPERQKAEPVRSDELNAIFDRLQTTHCKD